MVSRRLAGQQKRIERLWREHGLQLPPRKAENSGQKALGDDSNSIWPLPSEYRNHIWSCDFIKGRASNGRAVRVLNVMDEFTRYARGSQHRRPSVQEHLERLFASRGGRR